MTAMSTATSMKGMLIMKSVKGTRLCLGVTLRVPMPSALKHSARHTVGEAERSDIAETCIQPK